MRATGGRSAAGAALTLLAATLLATTWLAAAGCGRRASKDEALADAYWQRLAAEPEVWDSFLALNQKAALAHGDPHDAKGIEYQARALTAQAGRAAAAKDATMAGRVTDRVAELRAKGLLEEYEATLPGSRDRLLAAERQAASVVR